MKKILLTMLIVLGTTATMFAQLNADAKAIKNESPDIYSVIKQESVKKWGSDHEMIVYRINNQCEAVFEISKAMQKSNYNERIMRGALDHWKTGSGYDYEMVMYTYNNQLEASNSY